MIESNLAGGRQELVNKADLVYGQSITDACVDFETTERMLEALASELMARPSRSFARQSA
jgi:3-deoxy-7-phosphoheptulonate synthase